MHKAIFFFCFLLGIFVLSILLFNHEEENTERETNQKKVRSEYLESFYNDKKDYEQAFDLAECQEQENIVAGIVSHHFLAKDMIAEFFDCINPENVENIVIISPDHFNSLPKNELQIFTTLLDWETPYGSLKANNSSIENKIKNWTNIIGLNNTAFRTEHGIYTLIPFVKKVFPEARVIPLILQNSDNYEKYFEVGKSFYKRDTILIASIDFAHHTNLQEAEYYDQKSIEALKTKDIGEIDKIEADCNHCIAFLYGFIHDINTDIDIIDNKTSKDFGWEYDNDLTTYISVYYKEQ